MILFAASASGAEQAPSEPGRHYYYFKERQSLALDPTRVAILRNARSSISTAELLRQSGAALEVNSARDWHPGWAMVATRAEARTSARLGAVIDRLKASRGVDFVSPVFRGMQGGPVVITPTILVAFHPGVSPELAEAVLAEVDTGEIVERDWGNMRGSYRIRTRARDGNAVLEIANNLAVRNEVRYAEPNVIFTGRGELVPDDTLFGDLWGIHNTGQAGGTPDIDMDGPEAWDMTMGDPSIKVVIIDTGIEQSHPDLNQLPGIDVTTVPFTMGGGPANNCDNHGTALAGSISGIINNSLGVVGIAPDCKVVSARTFISLPSCDGTITGESRSTVDALAYAESIGAKVTNNSNSYDPIRSAAIDSKYAQTRADGMVHFASAGFGNNPISNYPAWLPSVNTIAGVERNGSRSSITNYGYDLFLTAPGEDILTTDRTGAVGFASGDYVSMTGSSLATSYAAGVAALVFSLNPNRPAWAVESIMKDTAVDMGPAGFDVDYGWGLVNAHAAVLAASEICDEPGQPDCNANNILDSCDLFEGTSSDCNANQVPDECESQADCQSNGIVDICEIGMGLARDCNHNFVPDDCDLLAPSAADCQGNGILDECDNAGVGSIVSNRPGVLGFIEISGFGIPLGLGDDAVAEVNMPFVAAAYPGSRLVVANDGGISLDGRTTLFNPNRDLPTNRSPFEGGEALLPYWDDLDRTSGNIYYATVGEAPNRTFIVEWYNRAHLPGDFLLDGDEATFQVQIFETPVQDVITQFLYADTNFQDVNLNDGRSATIGYQLNAAQVIKWSFNTAGAVTGGTVLSLLMGDRNGSGVPDACESLPPDPHADPTLLEKSRIISFSVPSSTTAAAGETALRVRLVSLHHVVPPYSGGASAPFTSFEGEVRWVGPPVQYVESTSSGIPFHAAQLQCTPHYQDWTTLGLLHVTGSAITPSSTYEVENLAASCAGLEGSCTAVSVPISISTTRWGDVETPYNPPSATVQPDVADISALVNKFRSAPGALIKARGVLAGDPGNPFGEITPAVLGVDYGFSHISACVDAFRGVPYPYTISNCP